MFSFNTVVDSINKSQKDIVKFAVRDQDLAQAMNQSLDAQADLARGMAKTAVDLSAKFTAESTKIMSEIVNYDYAGAAQRMSKSWVPAAK